MIQDHCRIHQVLCSVPQAAATGKAGTGACRGTTTGCSRRGARTGSPLRRRTKDWLWQEDYKRTRDGWLYKWTPDEWLYKRTPDDWLYKRTPDGWLYKRTPDGWLYKRTPDARKSCGSHEVAWRERSVIRDNHRGTAVVGIGDEWSTDRSIQWNKLRFCQHYTGEGHKSEEHLQNRGQDIGLTYSSVLFVG